MTDAAAELARNLLCRRVDSLEDWNKLQPHWNRLLERSAESTPWQSFEHLSCWWRHLHDGRALRIYVVEAQGEPLLILPLQLTNAVNSGVRVRWLEPIGMLDDINRPQFALGGGDWALRRLALSALWNDRREWDGLRIDERPVAGDDAQVLRQFAATRGLLFRELPFHPCPYLQLDGTWEQFQRSTGTRLVKNLRAAQRKLEKHGKISLRIYQDPAAIEAGFEIFLAIQQYSWKHLEGIGLSRSLAYRSYYRDFLREMSQLQQARILALFVDQQPVAATIAVMAGNTYYAAQIVHDERCAESSPGTLLESMEFHDLFQQRRFHHYDFFGAALNNKLRWTKTVRETSRLILLQPTVKMRLLDTYWLNAKPVIKRLRATLRASQDDVEPILGDGVPF